ncbi:hypothetical protein BGX29_005246 [Mortierella sp. GBA35]|nr:hypothetical protein BGX29_005246 [Mortierella sp. GBA35]
MRIPRPLSRFILVPQQRASKATPFSTIGRDSTRFTEAGWTRSLLTVGNSPRVMVQQEPHSRNGRGVAILAQDLAGRSVRCMRGQDCRSLLLPTLQHRSRYTCGRLATTTTARTLMTQTRQQDPIVKFFGDNDDRITPQEYKIRVGKAIRTLREELPQFFRHGLYTTSIYAPNIRLIEASHTNVSLQGKPIYFLLAGAVRWSFKMWFRDIEFEIQSIRVNDRGGRGISGLDSGNDSDNMSTTTSTVRCTRSPAAAAVPSCSAVQSTGVDGININQGGGGGGIGGQGGPSIPGTTVTVRWTLKGTTRPSVVLTSSGPTSPPPSSYAGIFVYELDDRGLIDEHRIENIMPSPSPEAIERAFAWWGWLLSRTRPAATATFEDAASSRKRLGLD